MPRNDKWAFYQNDDYYAEAMNQTHVVAFNFYKYQEQATIKLRKLFEEFQLAAFNPHRMIPGLGKLETSVHNFSGTHNYAAYDVDLLRDISLSLQTTINSIENPGLNWLDELHFDPGAPYENVKNILLE